MEAPLLRPAVPEDLAALTELWKAAFHDPEALVRRLLTEGRLLRCALVAEVDGCAASAMFAFPGLTAGGRSAAYLYALCTHPALQGRGLGSAVLQALCRRCFAAGTELVFLSPADAGLSLWYQEKFGMTPLGAMDDVPQILAPGPVGRCTRLEARAYAALRRDSVGLTLSLLQAQGILLEAEGGGFYQVELPQGQALACAMPLDGVLLVLELVCPPAWRDAALRSLAAKFGTEQLRLRGPGTALPLLGLCPDGAAVSPPTGLCFPFIMD